MGKYYAVKEGIVPGIYDNWAECEKQIKGFKGAIYKSFKTLEEAESFYNSKLDKAEYYKTDKKKSSQDVADSSKSENSEKLLANIKGRQPIPEGLDAVIYADGSFQKKYDEIDAYNGSYGIVLFSKNGAYVESTLLYDPDNQNEKTFLDKDGCGYFIAERCIFKDGHFTKQDKSEIKFKASNVENKENYGILHNGLSQAAEFIGAARAIDICMKLNYKKVMLAYDSMTIVQSFNKYDKLSDSASSNFFKLKVREAVKQGMELIIDDYTKVDSHANGEEKVKNPSLIENYFGLDDYIYNDLVDILAKIQILKQPVITVGWDNDGNKLKAIKNENLAISNKLAENEKNDLIINSLREKANKVLSQYDAMELKQTYLEWGEELVSEILSMDSEVRNYFKS